MNTGLTATLTSCGTAYDKATSKEETLSDRLRFVLKTTAISKSELARRIGVKQQVIQYLCDSNTKASSFTYKIADALNINPMWLATGSGHMFLEDDINYQILSKHKKIPLITTDVLKAVINDKIDISKIDTNKWVLTENTMEEESYALTIKDQSMFPRFEENTVIIINRRKQPKNGDYVVVYIHKNKEILFRQLIIKNKAHILQPMNLNGYQPIVMTKQDILCGTLGEARWTL